MENSLRNEMLPFEAADMWCSTRTVALAMGSAVQYGHPVWHFYLKLRQILDVIMAPSFIKCELQYLEILIAEYLEERRSLFPDDTLKNKHHHLVHYPRLMLQMGPLCRFWCMRFESKHQRAKRIMHVSGCYKNVPCTIATRHQYEVAYRVLQGCNKQQDVELGYGCVICLDDLSDGEEISKCMNDIGLHFELYRCNSICVRGVTYKPGCYIVCSTGEQPAFAEVLYILARENGQKVWFVCEEVKTDYFDEHYHSWKVLLSV